MVAVPDPGIDKIRPYEHLSDAELNGLVADATDLQFRLRAALLNPAAIEATLTSHGCPAVSAARMLRDPILRPLAARFHIDAADAILGDPDARARVDHAVAGWEKLRERGAPASGGRGR